MDKPKRRQRSEDKPRNKAPLPSHKLQCFSVACLDMPHLEFGDKIVLPPKVLLELQCFKIPTPLLFMLRPAGQPEDSSEQCCRQYCSVQEFSAPDGQVFLPYWLMQNLHLPEGNTVVVTSVVNIPRGIYCRLQPESSSFLDLAAEIGPKLLMETAMRRYSILSTNSNIVIEYGKVRYYLRVAELQPVSVVSLCGDVDLETDFMPPEGSNPTRPPSGKSPASNESAPMHSVAPYPSAIGDETTCPDSYSMGYGRRLRDGGYVESESSDTVTTKVRIPMSSLQKVQQSIRDKQSKPVSTDAVAAAVDSLTLAAQLRFAQGSFSKPGYTLGTAELAMDRDEQKSPSNWQPNSLEVEQTTEHDRSDLQSNASTCKLCLADVSAMNLELHTLRCAKNPTYHKFECPICHDNVLRVHENQHQHCPDCAILCESSETMAHHQQREHTASCKCKYCSELFTRAGRQNHVDNNQCESALIPCLLCGLAFKKMEMTHHSVMCSSRTERCDVCKLYVKITESDSHREQCEAQITHASLMSGESSNPPRKTNASNQIECAYCLQGGFAGISDVEHHVLHDCRVAKSFTASNIFPTGSSNQDEADQLQTGASGDLSCVETTRPLLAQGHMRRRGDIDALLSSSSSRRSSPSNASQTNHRLKSSRCVQGPSLLPTSRPPLQPGKLKKLKPRPNPQLRALPHQAPKSVNQSSISANSFDLCISNAGGTSQNFAAAPSRSEANVRRRPCRLDKLP